MAASTGGDGIAWLTGSGAPNNSHGNDGDFYLDTSNGDYYLKVSGVWGSPEGNLTGPQGPAGPTGPQGPEGASPFLLDGSDVHFTGGNMGIGTATPQVALDVVGDTNISGNINTSGIIIIDTDAGDIPSITY